MTYSKSEKDKLSECIDKMFPGISPELRKSLSKLSKVLIKVNKNLEKLKEGE